MRPSLSRRLGAAMGTRVVEPEDQARIREAARTAEDWRDLPAGVQRLVEDLERRPPLRG